MIELVYESVLGTLFLSLTFGGAYVWIQAIRKNKIRKAVFRERSEQKFQKERENWISLLDDRQNAIGDLVTENSKLQKEIETLKKLLSDSEALRLGK